MDRPHKAASPGFHQPHNPSHAPPPIREQTRNYRFGARPRNLKAVPSLAWAVENRKTIFSPNVEALRKAFVDSGRAVPEAFDARASEARD
jgi:hypothetical protein